MARVSLTYSWVPFFLVQSINLSRDLTCFGHCIIMERLGFIPLFVCYLKKKIENCMLDKGDPLSSILHPT